ncbi:MAG: hypothetical protein AAB403_18445 [Planctomycetota bacterium]
MMPRKPSLKYLCSVLLCCLLVGVGVQAQDVANAPTAADRLNYSTGAAVMLAPQAPRGPLALSCGPVLVYDNNSRYQTALSAATNLGLPHTRAFATDFNTLITSQTWGLVVMDLPSNEPGSGWQTNLINHINGGGKAIHSHWHPNTLWAALQAAFEVSNQGAHQTVTFYQWNSHPLFSAPNSVLGLFDVWVDVWATNGFYLQPTGSAQAAAGFTASPAANQAAIVIGNGGRTIFNGFLFDDYYPADKDLDSVRDIVELLENEIAAVCGPLVVDIDIKFCSNPNGYNCGTSGKMPVTIFGTASFNVSGVDINSLKLCRADNLNSCTTAPKSWSTADRGNPATDIGASSCAIVDGVEQHYLHPDGFLDLDVAFDSGEVSSLIGCPLAKRSASPGLVLVGKLLNGQSIQSVPVNNVGVDQLYIQN